MTNPRAPRRSKPAPRRSVRSRFSLRDLAQVLIGAASVIAAIARLLNTFNVGER